MLNNGWPPFKPGELVTTDYDHADSGMLRRVVFCQRLNNGESGWVVGVDAGVACRTCGKKAQALCLDSGRFRKWPARKQRKHT